MLNETSSKKYLSKTGEYSADSEITSNTTDRLHLDSLKVGQVFYSQEHYVSADEIIAFSSKYDPQPFHMDDELAKGSIFKGLTASGWLTVSITMSLLVKSLPLAHGIIGSGVEKIKWYRPTRPSDVLRIIATITEIKASNVSPDRARVSIHISTIGQDDKIRQELIGKLIVFDKKKNPELSYAKK